MLQPVSCRTCDEIQGGVGLFEGVVLQILVMVATETHVSEFRGPKE